MPDHGHKGWSLRVIAALGCLLSVGTAAASELEDYLEAVRVEHGLPALAAAVVLNGEVVAVSAVGTRVAGRDIPVTLDDRFHIGSNTKSMTATLAGMMVDEGLLSWDSTVSAVLERSLFRHCWSGAHWSDGGKCAAANALDCPHIEARFSELDPRLYSVIHLT